MTGWQSDHHEYLGQLDWFLYWLVVWLTFFIFPYIGFLIIPIDQYFSEGWLNHQPVTASCRATSICCFFFWVVYQRSFLQDSSAALRMSFRPFWTLTEKHRPSEDRDENTTSKNPRTWLGVIDSNSYSNVLPQFMRRSHVHHRARARIYRESIYG